MARVTIEDCLGNVDNRFQLVLVATKRARQILLGGQPMVEEDNDKPTVLALREIAAGHVTREILTQPDYDASLDDDFFENEEGAEGAMVSEPVTNDGEVSDEALAASISEALEDAPEAETIAGEATDVSDESSQIS